MTVGTRLMVLSVGLAIVVGIVHGTTAAPEAQAPAASATQMRQLAYLKASNADGSDHFACGGSLPGHIGNALAISGDGNTMAVGAPHESSATRGINGNQDDNSLYNSGAVYVYVRSGDDWTQQAYIKASNAGQSDMFGLSLSLSGDGNTLAVAAPWEASGATGVNGDQNDNSIPQAGAVYVFARLADGSTLAAGAVSEDSKTAGVNGAQADDSAFSSGAVYVFTKTDNAWAQQAYIKSGNSGGGDLFGYGVGLSADGSTIAAGAGDEACLNGGINPSGCDVETFPEHLAAGSAGAAYIWVRSGGTWTEQAFIKASNPNLEDWFAARLALSSDGRTVAVGARMENGAATTVNGDQNDNEAGQSGAVYVFVE